MQQTCKCPTSLTLADRCAAGNFNGLSHIKHGQNWHTLHHGTRCRGVARQTMESSYGSGTPTMRSENADVTSTGLSAVPQGASSLRTRALNLLQGILLQHQLANTSMHVNQAKLRRTSPRGRYLCPLPSLPAPPCKGHSAQSQARCSSTLLDRQAILSPIRAAYTSQTRSAASCGSVHMQPARTSSDSSQLECGRR